MSAAQTSLPPEPVSVPAARRFVRSCLEELGATAAWESAEMLVSEVATNAVLHGRTPFTVSVHLDEDRVRVRVSVTDLSSVLPRPRSYGTDSTTGRGLRLVASLSSAWGVDLTGTGKTVWFEVAADGGSGTRVASWDGDTDVDALLAAFDDTDSDPSAPPTSLHALLPLGALLLRVVA